MTRPDDEHTTRSARDGGPVARPSALVVPTSGQLRIVPLGVTGTIEIGRSDGCAIKLEDESVSRRHARIVLSASVVTVEDLGSRNGTRLFGAPIAKGRATVAPATSILQIGDVPLVFVDAVTAGESSRGCARSPGIEAPVVADPKMVDLFALLDVIAPTDIAVLVLGETGTGKEVFAAEIHARSRRKDAKLLCLNCAAVPESLLEAELFGHERGAFTGATHAKPGLFESANGGTVFLDELGEMPAATQAKLLRVLESGEVMRIGARSPTKIDVRIIGATNRDLSAAMQSGQFRSDLYFRVAGFTLTLPPLRERPADIVALTDHFVATACAAAGRAPLVVTDATRAALARHAFSGNVRELKAAITRGCVLSTGATLEVDHLGLGSVPAPSATEAASGSEESRIQAALEAAGGNQTRAAQVLGISRATLVRRLDALGLVRPRKGR